MFNLYKQREKRIFYGVLAGLAERYQWDLSLTRFIFVLIALFSPINVLVIIAYFIAGKVLPYKKEQRFYYEAPGQRRRKDAEIIEDRDWF